MMSEQQKRPWPEVMAGAIVGLGFSLALLQCSPVAAASLCTEWDDADTALAVAAGVVTAADWLQTRQIVKRHQGGDFSVTELNPLIGPRPTMGKVNSYFITSIAAAALLTCTLSPTHRKWLLGGILAAEVAVVVHNKGLGLNIKF